MVVPVKRRRYQIDVGACIPRIKTVSELERLGAMITAELDRRRARAALDRQHPQAARRKGLTVAVGETIQCLDPRTAHSEPLEQDVVRQRVTKR